jgi:hypothetical protein
MGNALPRLAFNGLLSRAALVNGSKAVSHANHFTSRTRLMKGERDGKADHRRQARAEAR